MVTQTASLSLSLSLCYIQKTAFLGRTKDQNQGQTANKPFGSRSYPCLVGFKGQPKGEKRIFFRWGFLRTIGKRSSLQFRLSVLGSSDGPQTRKPRWFSRYFSLLDPPIRRLTFLLNPPNRGFCPPPPPQKKKTPILCCNLGPASRASFRGGWIRPGKTTRAARSAAEETNGGCLFWRCPLCWLERATKVCLFFSFLFGGGNLLASSPFFGGAVPIFKKRCFCFGRQNANLRWGSGSQGSLDLACSKLRFAGAVL